GMLTRVSSVPPGGIVRVGQRELFGQRAGPSRVVALLQGDPELRHHDLARVALPVVLDLMLRAGQVCSREELLTEVWGYTFDPGSNIVDVYLGRLRAKLDPGQIETVRNIGYSFIAKACP